MTSAVSLTLASWLAVRVIDRCWLLLFSPPLGATLGTSQPFVLSIQQTTQHPAVIDSGHCSSTLCPKEDAGDQQPASHLEQTPRRNFKTPGKAVQKASSFTEYKYQVVVGNHHAARKGCRVTNTATDGICHVRTEECTHPALFKFKAPRGRHINRRSSSRQSRCLRPTLLEDYKAVPIARAILFLSYTLSQHNFPPAGAKRGSEHFPRQWPKTLEGASTSGREELTALGVSHVVIQMSQIQPPASRFSTGRPPSCHSASPPSHFSSNHCQATVWRNVGGAEGRDTKREGERKEREQASWAGTGRLEVIQSGTDGEKQENGSGGGLMDGRRDPRECDREEQGTRSGRNTTVQIPFRKKSRGDTHVTAAAVAILYTVSDSWRTVYQTTTSEDNSDPTSTHSQPAVSTSVEIAVPPTLANWIELPVWSLPDFRMWESCRTMLLVHWFSQGSPVSPALSFWRCSTLTSLHPHWLSRSQFWCGRRVSVCHVIGMPTPVVQTVGAPLVWSAGDFGFKFHSLAPRDKNSNVLYVGNMTNDEDGLWIIAQYSCFLHQCIMSPPSLITSVIEDGQEQHVLSSTYGWQTCFQCSLTGNGQRQQEQMNFSIVSNVLAHRRSMTTLVAASVNTPPPFYITGMLLPQRGGRSVPCEGPWPPSYQLACGGEEKLTPSPSTPFKHTLCCKASILLQDSQGSAWELFCTIGFLLLLLSIGSAMSPTAKSKQRNFPAARSSLRYPKIPDTCLNRGLSGLIPDVDASISPRPSLAVFLPCLPSVGRETIATMYLLKALLTALPNILVLLANELFSYNVQYCFLSRMRTA
ncbi:hypothetical protein PR048_029456 [Dryococelus australis]|uniref:Uncharacterized protein n=1 Tax=Dryococelus australis TaxID=614101 RepID=A0ABQ9GG65_9NEOP|nr:hypothetical protein PR048_029456 [Dryococelus australis]